VWWSASPNSTIGEALAAAEVSPLPAEALAELRGLYERGLERD
jgi:hypothetical protein